MEGNTFCFLRLIIFAFFRFDLLRHQQAVSEWGTVSELREWILYVQLSCRFHRYVGRLWVKDDGHESDYVKTVLGLDCQTRMSSCDQQPCRNGAKCIAVSVLNIILSYFILMPKHYVLTLKFSPPQVH
jgi:hypothetical protein